MRRERNAIMTYTAHSLRSIIIDQCDYDEFEAMKYAFMECMRIGIYLIEMLLEPSPDLCLCNKYVLTITDAFSY